MKKRKIDMRSQKPGTTDIDSIHSSSALKRIASRLLPIADFIKLLLSRSTVAIHGSYFTTNVGDRAIGMVLKEELKRRGISSTLVSRFCSHPLRRNIVVGGGGVIHNHYYGNIELRTAFVEKGNCVMYIGVGCPGFINILSSDKNRLRKIEQADYVSVRDVRSKQVLMKEIDVDPEVLACPAWLFDRHLQASDFSIRNMIFRGYFNLMYRPRRSAQLMSGRKKIGVVLNRHFDPAHLPTIKTMLERLSSECSLYLIPFVGEDLEFFRDQLSDVPMTCLKLRGPVATYKALLDMDRVIATRYHSAIFSLLAGKPVMILAYSEKVVSLALDLKLMYADLRGPREQSFEFNEQVDGELIQRKIEEAEQQTYRIASHLT